MADLELQSDAEKTQEAQIPIGDLEAMVSGSPYGDIGGGAPAPASVKDVLDNPETAGNGASSSTGKPLDADAQLDVDIRKKMAERDEIFKRQQEGLDTREKELRGDIKDISNLQQPRLGEAPKPPSRQEIMSGGMEWMQMAAALGALAGGLGRKNSTAALNAFGSAIKGFAQGKTELWNQSLEEWKAADQKMREDNQARLDQYNLIWNNKKMALELKLAAFKIAAQKYNDEMTYNVAQTGDIEKLYELHQRNQILQQQADYKAIGLQLMLDRNNRANQYIQDNKDSARDFVQDMKDGLMPPNAPAPAAVRRFVPQMIKELGFNQAQATIEWTGAVTSVRNLNSNQMNRFAGAAITVINSIDTALEMSKQLKLGGFNLLNKAELLAAVKTRGNTPEGQLAAKYLQTIAVVKEESAQVASGGYAPTESAWHQAEAMVNGDFGTQELEATLKNLQKLLRYRLQGIPGFSTRGPLGQNRYNPPPENRGILEDRDDPFAGFNAQEIMR